MILVALLIRRRLKIAKIPLLIVSPEFIDTFSPHPRFENGQSFLSTAIKAALSRKSQHNLEHSDIFRADGAAQFLCLIAVQSPVAAYSQLE